MEFVNIIDREPQPQKPTQSQKLIQSQNLTDIQIADLEKKLQEKEKEVMKI